MENNTTQDKGVQTKLVSRTCKFCGEKFLAKQSKIKIGQALYCSRLCSDSRRLTSPEKRFWKYVKKGKGCWAWVGSISSSGYGWFSLGTGISAHRFSYALHNCKINNGIPFIEKGLEVRHTCDNPSCVNPDHLVLGTHQDNMDDMKNRGRSNNGAKTPPPKQ